ncbi:MAG TPA: DNA-formamidopyrimidine glycosylase family protein [Acidimicrobiales bacterium]
MPEGDTLHRIADRLRPRLEGHRLVRFEAPRVTGYRPRPGDRIESVEAVGKHLLVRFERGIVLQTHLRMTGTWHLYRTGERWQRGAHRMRVLIAVDGWEAVCFDAPVVRTFVEGAQPSPVDHLGPDLCREDADIDEAVRRMATVADPDATIAEVLLDQRVSSGIGNVYKSEVLFACRLDPFTPLAAIDHDLRRRLIETAARQLRANLGDGRRQTVPGGLAVYGRARRTCRVCGTPIRSRRHGAQPRVTYWCPRCQLPPPAPASTTSPTTPTTGA